MAYDNLPGVRANKIDGNLATLPVNNNPIVVVIGTAERGSSDLTAVPKVGAGAKTYGTLGTLNRGINEVATSGGLNIQAMRIGASAAKLSSVGTGITIVTASKDDSAGTDYKLYWDDTAKRLYVYRVLDGILVYDNNPAYPEQVYDVGEVYVSGFASGTPGSIGTLGTPITLAAANGVSGAVYTAGTDGTTLCRMRLWEELYKAYKALEDANLDYIVPMNAYLDDANIQDLTTAQVTTLQTGAPWAASANAYPVAGSAFDTLGKVYVEEYNGEYIFWWDLNRNSTAEIWPVGKGSSSASLKSNGNALAAADFHEVNFAYDLARFCFDKSQDNDEIYGVIGMRPPLSLSPTDISAWVGELPTFTTDSAGVSTISVNGKGMLGNKYMTGRKGNSGTGLPAFTVDGIDGRYGGGFIARDTVWVDSGSELKDSNNKLIDLGKFISVVGGQAILSNNAVANSYIATAAPSYAGFVTTLPANSAPTNKVMAGLRLPFRLNLSKLNALAGAKYTMLQGKAKGVVVSDAPTAARTESDYNRVSTVRIVKATIDALRLVADPYLGEGLSGLQQQALDTAMERVLDKLVKAGFLQRYSKQLVVTPADAVLGKAILNLTLVPAFELRELTINVSLAAQ
jgi:hypothetical protein